VAQKKRFSKGTMELRESCLVEELGPLPALAPAHDELPLSSGWDGFVLPGGEISFLGRAIGSKRRPR
jgi:hypothetical protein